MAGRSSLGDGPLPDGAAPTSPQPESDGFANHPVSSAARPTSSGADATSSALPPAPNSNPTQTYGIPVNTPAGLPKPVEDVISSEIGIPTLLSRLKQSVTSARDFAAFLKKRSALEDEHAQGLRKLAKTILDSIRRQDARQGSYSRQLSAVTQVHERMADSGVNFCNAMRQMHDELTEMSNTVDRGRKDWKTDGLANEKRVKDAELALQKAKARYDSLAEDYDRARTGDRTSGKVFGLKGPKSAAQHEEDLLRKVQNADADYASKVQLAHAARQENLTTQRPQAIKALQALIAECDSALTMQLQRFAGLSERHLVTNGMAVSPVKSENSAGPPSMRDMIASIDNTRDLHAYISGHSSQIPPRPLDIKYEKHPALGPPSASSPSAPRMPQTQQPPAYPAQAPSNFSVQTQPSYSPQSVPQTYSTQSTPQSPQVPQQGFAPSPSFSGPPSQGQWQPSPTNGQQYNKDPSFMPSPTSQMNVQKANGVKQPTSAKPVFGVSLEDLYARDGSAVPTVIYQCIQAVDAFGLEVEGIYRLSGNANHINQMKALIDSDATRLDFRNPESFHHDVNSVAGLLKQFMRDLPDPLLTSEHYTEFIEAARAEDPIVRRDSLHAVINSLPDPNYATLRAVVLHLNRVQEHSNINRMSTSNLAICISPSMMGPHKGPRMADAGLQARVIDTILQNTLQIFDED